jgi:uncharacterized protein with HEPN domain
LSRRSDLDWLQDVTYSAERIQRSIAIDKNEEFEEIIFDAIQYNLVCIGEAVRQISNDLKQENSEIPWQLVTGMRNRLTHEYFQISRDQVESVIVEHLEPFVDQCKELKSQLAKQIG